MCVCEGRVKHLNRPLLPDFQVRNQKNTPYSRVTNNLYTTVSSSKFFFFLLKISRKLKSFKFQSLFSQRCYAVFVGSLLFRKRKIKYFYEIQKKSENTNHVRVVGGTLNECFRVKGKKRPFSCEGGTRAEGPRAPRTGLFLHVPGVPFFFSRETKNVKEIA